MAAQTQAPGQGEPRHGLRIFVAAVVLAIVADLLIWFVLGPHLPPGTMTSSAVENQRAIKLMAVMSAPVVVMVIVYFGYALVVWRHREGDDEDGPAIHGNTNIQTTWIVGTTEQVAERLLEYADAGVDGVYLQHLAHEDLETVALIGHRLAPLVSAE